MRLAAKGGADRVTVDALSATDTFQVDADLGATDGEVDRATVSGSGDDDSISIGRFSEAVSVLGPTFVRFENAEPADRLTVAGRGGRMTSARRPAPMTLTLDAAPAAGPSRRAR